MNTVCVIQATFPPTRGNVYPAIYLPGYLYIYQIFALPCTVVILFAWLQLAFPRTQLQFQAQPGKYCKLNG